jgi:hypothetical protein
MRARARATRASPVVLCALVLVACGPGEAQDPRDRKGGDGPATWRLVDEAGRAAAFLSRPGAAPDLVVWCKGDGRVTLRAHVFETDAAATDLSLTTPGGALAFANVRRQGALRGDRPALIEGSADATRAAAQAVLAQAGQVSVASGGERFDFAGADPDGLLAGFAKGCAGR